MKPFDHITGLLVRREAEPPWDNIEPIRSELFNAERLEEHAVSLAKAQPAATRPVGRRPIARRLDENAVALLEDYRALIEAVGRGRPITPAAEWLVDNYHIVEVQVRHIREDLPSGYYRELPKLAEGPFTGYPRVLGIAWAYVAHTDSLFDPDILARFVRAYQSVQELTIGELWAIAITLRIVLVENLRRLADRIVRARVEREAADGLADQLLAPAGSGGPEVAELLKLFEANPISNTFAVQLTQRLRDWDQDSAQVTSWLERRLAQSGMTIERAVVEEHQRQTAANVSVRNIFTSMRLITDVDWMEWFESVSLIDALLRRCAGYNDMDFATRNMYRSAIEELARGSAHTEHEIGRRVSEEAQAKPAGERTADPGFYLIREGRPSFEASLDFRPKPFARFRRGIRAAGIAGYVGAIGLITALFAAILLAGAGVPASLVAVLGILALLPASDAAVALVNYAVTKILGAKPLPALELKDGVPRELATLVAVPALLTSHQAVEDLIDRLEVHYLSDSQGHLTFALLSDWTDAADEETPSDQPLLQAALDGVNRLNATYDPTGTQPPFLLLHRRRVHNEREGCWMGWERKRGKLHELNRLLRGDTDTTFMVVGGRLPDNVRYVITLDADTRIPRETARHLVGKMAHPLNRPELDQKRCLVVAGHGILQPRVTPSLSHSNHSLYQRIFSTPRGLDPYVFAVSDVYQDLFDEGSFAGKGIYDIDTFEACLTQRVPENTMLSHDLFEGIFARSGLVTDIEVIEDFPARYEVAAARQHRWVRGDWQLLPWLAGRMPAQVSRDAASLPRLGSWKMLDNLRRSLSPPLMILALIAGLVLLPIPAAVAFTAILAAMVAFGPLLPLLDAVVPKHRGITLGSHLRTFVSDVGMALAQVVMTFVFLGHQAWLMGDAIVRTLHRLLVSRRKLLEWTTAAQLQRGPEPSFQGYYRQMAGSLVVAVATLAAGVWSGENHFLLALPFALAWLAAPAIAKVASRPPPPSGSAADLAPESIVALRLIARRTWRFFEHFVTPADNMLPPDNFQEEPRPVVAQRTSPTNIGLYLLCAAAARDLGWSGLPDTIDRLEATFATLKRLETYRGHFLNWYATADLRSLEPRYVSTVDSGNLCAHLIALANSCRAWIEEPGISPAMFDGIEDNLLLIRDALRNNADDRRSLKGMRRQINDDLTALMKGVATMRTTPELASVRLIELSLQAGRLNEIAEIYAKELKSQGTELLVWTKALQTCIESHFRDVTASADDLRSRRRRLSRLEKEARDMARNMEFDFLLNRQRNLFAIGYRVAEGTLDPNCYDMLASEARLASFTAIAKGDARPKHWFKLDRSVTAVELGAALLSWSGSMFEYLMPLIVMRAPPRGILSQTNELAVKRQIAYGSALGIPWGVSESAFNARDVEFTYQYSNFGVPGLGLKRGLADNVVVAPYATGLAAMIAPAEAVRNYERLAREGGLGAFGYYEALDYTPARVPEGKTVAVVKAYMAHHQGMTIAAIANTLKDWLFCNRFHQEPMVRATELLLQERAPRGVPVTHGQAEPVDYDVAVRDHLASMMRRVRSVHTAVPATHLLSNGAYTVMITAAGSGYSTWRGLAVTRWRDDTTCDDSGSYIYLRDVDSGEAWSAGYQPMRVEGEDYHATFAEDRVEIHRRDGSLTTTLECVVSPEENAEVRRITISNGSRQRREIELTSYAELVLSPAVADNAHPAFSKLFVETEFHAETGAIIATRRRRSPNDPEMWAAHLLVVDGTPAGELEAETDRMRFLGRGNRTGTPAALSGRRPLSNTFGTVLDPIFALRQRIRVPAGGAARCAFWTLAAASRAELIDLIDRHRPASAFDRAAMLAWTQAQIQLRHLAIEAEEAGLYQQLASYVIYPSSQMRPASGQILRGLASQSALWPHGISGDRPIVLVRLDDVEDINIVRQMLRAHEYWRMKQLNVDLVILNERASSYAQDLQGAIEALVRTARARSAPRDGRSGEVYLLRADLLSPQAAAFMPAVARIVLSGRRGTLGDQLARVREPQVPLPPTAKAKPTAASPAPRPTDLEFFNGFGGFSANGAEYVVHIDQGRLPPAPWINVVANPSFGFHAAAEGGGYTWSLNSRDRQITPWPNDPVSNPPSEAFYVVDRDTGDVVSPTYLPVRDSGGPYRACFGAGYCRFEHQARGLGLELVQFVPSDAAVKISRLKIRNTGRSRRRLAVVAYVEWVLAAVRGSAAPFTTTGIEPQTGALVARNPWNVHFGSQVAFLDLGGRQTSHTGDRREFLGRHGSTALPAALEGESKLSNTVGAGFDPCGALMTTVELGPEETIEVVALLGDAPSEAAAAEIVTRFRAANLDQVFDEVKGTWRKLLTAVEIKTPERQMDVLVNNWLLYQSVACRIWGRSGYYQASGAFGFRDQLQDTMALLIARPDIARHHILEAAGRQFREGDVQHWWLPTTGGLGIRTRISDDTVWLAHCTAHYIETTGDKAVLDEIVPFLEGQTVGPHETDAFFQPETSEETGSLFEHCVRALDISLTQGPHGLPLMGTGDWNDGMNTVGVQGKGESVWLGWFLHATLITFAGIAAERGEAATARKWRRFAEQLKAALAESGWDGQWYRRAYFDDGTPLGSADNAECRIDSIAQSWSVLSGAAERPRAHTAMLESWRQLVRRDRRLALLLTPPFNRSVPNPGYIQSYPPGIRENGGQYTHAACWAVFAFAALGENEKAFELFHMLNPIGHGLRQADAERYRVEPYAVAADIYSVEPHAGRGGWTWYTGSAAWLYRAGLEAILGIRRQGAELIVAPCVPDSWPGFEVTLRFGTTTYRLELRRRGTAAAADESQAITAPARLPIVEDGGTHHHVIHFERAAREAPPVLRPTQEAAERTAIGAR